MNNLQLHPRQAEYILNNYETGLKYSTATNLTEGEEEIADEKFDKIHNSALRYKAYAMDVNDELYRSSFW